MKLDLVAWGAYTSDLRTAQQAALLQLAVVAWTQEPPCTLPADPDFLAERSGAGTAWPKLAPQLLTRFDGADDDRYQWPWLKALFDEQLRTYEARRKPSVEHPRARGGRFGASFNGNGTGPPTAHRTGDRSSDATSDPFGDPPAHATGQRSGEGAGEGTAERTADATGDPTGDPTGEPRQKLKELEQESLQTLVLVPMKGESAQARARVEDARALDAPERLAAHLAATYGPGVAANAAAAPEIPDERTALHGAYYRELKKHGERWMAEHPDTAAEMETKLRTDLGVPVGKPTRWLADVLLEAIRKHLHWPDAETWVERELTKRHATTTTPGESVDAFRA